MFRFVHSADWQLGKRFTGFGATAERLGSQRLTTLRAALEVARFRIADAFLVAGDLFDDNFVSDSIVDAAMATFAAFTELPVFLLPGNHDPATEGSSVWGRAQFREGNLPTNVTVLRETIAHVVRTRDGKEYALLAAPLRQKVSTVDPSLRLRELAAAQPADRLKIGLTHGSLAIPGKHQPNDFPIDLTASTRAGLDYLGVGHWHNWGSYDGGRLVMPGTPEPDGFDQTGAGHVAYVEIDAPGATPRVEAVPVAGLRWMRVEYDFQRWDSAQAAMEITVAGLGAALPQTVCRVRLHGAANPLPLRQAKEWIRERLRDAIYYEIDDQTRPALSAAEIAALERDHPILSQVLGDLRQLELLATGRTDAEISAPASTNAMPLAEAQSLAANARLELAALQEPDFLAARALLFGALAEASCPP